MRNAEDVIIKPIMTENFSRKKYWIYSKQRKNTGRKGQVYGQSNKRADYRI